jgi:hypothetical protein
LNEERLMWREKYLGLEKAGAIRAMAISDAAA